MDFRNLSEAIASERMGYLLRFDKDFPHIIDLIFSYMVGKANQKFHYMKYHVNMYAIYKYNLRCWVDSSSYMDYFFQFENYSKSYPSKVMGVFGVKLGSSFEEFGYERKFVEFWNYFHKLFLEKPKAKSIIKGIWWMINTQSNVKTWY